MFKGRGPSLECGNEQGRTSRVLKMLQKLGYEIVGVELGAWRHTQRFKSAEGENGQDLVIAKIGTRLWCW